MYEDKVHARCPTQGDLTAVACYFCELVIHTFWFKIEFHPFPFNTAPCNICSWSFFILSFEPQVKLVYKSKALTTFVISAVGSDSESRFSAFMLIALLVWFTTNSNRHSCFSSILSFLKLTKNLVLDLAPKSLFSLEEAVYSSSSWRCRKWIPCWATNLCSSRFQLYPRN